MLDLNYFLEVELLITHLYTHIFISITLSGSIILPLLWTFPRIYVLSYPCENLVVIMRFSFHCFLSPRLYIINLL